MKNIFLIFFLLIFSYSLFSQFTFTNYTTLNTGSNGLLDSRISSLSFGPDGKIWIATVDGFSFYDGNNWSYMNYEDFYPELTKNIVLFLDNNNDLWINQIFSLNDNLLLKYDGVSIINYGPANNYYPESYESNTFEDSDGYIYIKQHNNLLKFQNDTFTNINIPYSNVSMGCNITEDEFGKLIIYANQRGYRENNDGWEEIFHGSLRQISSLSDSITWMGGLGYYYLLYSNSIIDTLTANPQPYTTSNGLILNYSNIIEDNQGNIWSATNTNLGIVKYDGQSFEHFNKNNAGFHGNYFDDELLLNNGNLWFTNWIGGIEEWDGNQFNHINTFDGLVENTVNCILPVSDSLLFGTENGYSILKNINTWHSILKANDNLNVYASDNANKGYGIKDILKLSDDRLLFATERHGLLLMDTLYYGNYLYLTGYLNPADYTNKMLTGFNDDYWFAHNFGFAHYFGDSLNWANTANFWENFTTSNGLPNDTVYDLAKDNNGNIWLATANGIASFQNNTFTVYSTTQGLINNQTRSIYVDNTGNIWIGTVAGLSKYDGTTWQSYTTQDGLAGNLVNAIFQDSQGSMWFGTDEGLTKLANQTWSSYTTTDGLTDNYINSITEDNNGNLWIGTNFGASKLNIYQSIQNHTNSNSIISIFPNPASTSITITSAEAISSIEIYNQTGQLVKISDSYRMSLQENSYNIDISDLPVGSYFVRVISSSSPKTRQENHRLRRDKVSWVEKFVVVR